jgi:hypothetical protein
MENVVFEWFEWVGIGIMGFGAVLCIIMEWLDGHNRPYVYGFMIAALAIVATISIMVLDTFK